MTEPARRFAKHVATTLLARPWTWAAIDEALVMLCGRHDRRLGRLTSALAARFAVERSWSAVTAYLARSRRLWRIAAATLEQQPRATMLPIPGPLRALALPPLHTPGELARWLEVPLSRLRAWTRQFRPDPERRDDRLQHYHRRFVPRRRGPPRLIEAPKAELKRVQRRLLDELLAAVPVHASAHGFVRGRGVLTMVQPHTARAGVLRIDLQDFFATIGRPRVRGVFTALGYPLPVARLLAALCTTAAPPTTLARLRDHGPVGAALAERLRRPHLPQGAPTSPALANLVAFRLDARLHGLARRFGASYTRYADDLVCSGDASWVRDMQRCAAWIAAIARSEGFVVAHPKTRRMPASRAQRVGGLVVNVRPGVARRERDRLEAILWNCARHGPSTQSRVPPAEFRAHLHGRVAHVAHANARHGTWLCELFARIDWTR